MEEKPQGFEFLNNYIKNAACGSILFTPSTG